MNTLKSMYWAIALTFSLAILLGILVIFFPDGAEEASIMDDNILDNNNVSGANLGDDMNSVNSVGKDGISDNLDNIFNIVINPTNFSRGESI